VGDNGPADLEGDRFDWAAHRLEWEDIAQMRGADARRRLAEARKTLAEAPR